MIAQTGLLSVVYGLLSALSWGTGDFGGGLATRRTGVLPALVGSQLIGMILILVLALVRGEAMARPADLLLGAGAGLVGLAGLAALYRAMALGKMGIAAPLSTLLSTGLPVLVGAINEGLPSTTQFIGFGVALLGIWLISRPENSERAASAALGLALLAGVGFAGYLIIIDRVTEGSVFWPLATGRAVSLTAMLIAALITRRLVLPGTDARGLVALSAVGDAGGNVFFVLAAQTGRLDTAAVLSALFPAVTTVLARFILKEHMTRTQTAGVVCALAAIVLISLRAGS